MCELIQVMTSTHGKDGDLHATLYIHDYQMLRYSCQSYKFASNSFAKAYLTYFHVSDDPSFINNWVSAYTGKAEEKEQDQLASNNEGEHMHDHELAQQIE